MTIVAKTEDSDYPPTWKWEDEEPLEARHVEFRRVNGYDGGPVVVWELELDDKQRVSVWVEPAVLKTKLGDELRRRQKDRGTPKLEDGERVRIDPGAKRPSKRTAGQTVWPFPVVWFEHGIPDRSAEELLLGAADEGNGDDALDEAATDDTPPMDDSDVPF